MSRQPLPAIVVVAHNLRSLHNVGAIFRTADGCGASRVYLTGYTGTPPRDMISKTALGAELAVPWEYHRQVIPLLRKLRKAGYQVLALECAPNAASLPEFRPKYPVALVVGNEVTGLSPAILRAAHRTIAIPMLGVKASYNVSVAAGMALYALRYGPKAQKS